MKLLIKTSCLCLVAACLMTACKNDKASNELPSASKEQGMEEDDRTLYGICYAAAMHSFTLLTAAGDSIAFTKETLDEVGDVQGGLYDGDKLAVVMEKVEGENFARKVINLTSLLGRWSSIDRYFEIKDGGEVVSLGMAETKPYTEWKIFNGKLVLSADTFDVLTLGPDSMLLENDLGIFAYKRQKTASPDATVQR